MKKTLIILLLAAFLIFIAAGAVSSFFIMNSSEIITFKKAEKNTDGFHQINVAEKSDGGIIYYSGDKVVYYKDGALTELANNVRSLWREDSDIYYDSGSVLYAYNLKTKETKKMVENPHTILGKYNGRIISYAGENIYAIDETEKSKIFKDGYYLNRAVLYKNKVYGIPTSNVYEYNLDTLEIKKITDDPDGSSLEIIDGNLYIIAEKMSMGRRSHTYYKLTDEGLEKVFTVKNTAIITGEESVMGGIFIAAAKTYDDSSKGNRLLYIEDGKMIKVDEDYSYCMVGFINNELCYYKNRYQYGTYDENLKTFYLYDGKESREAFDLDVGFFETIEGYEYEGGLLIEISYELSTELYKYDGEKVEKLETPSNFYSIIGLDVIDDKAYIKYSEGEESIESAGTVIDLN